MPKLLIDIMGWAGSLLIIVAYILVSSGKLKGHSKIYQLLNFIGSLLLGFNTYYYRAIPAAALNIVWMCIGIYFLFGKRLISKKS